MTETRQQRRDQLACLFNRQGGKCAICGEPAVLDGNGGSAGYPDSAVRFRTRSKFGKPGRVRPRVMAHRKCAQARSAEIEVSLGLDELHARSQRHPTEFYSARGSE